MFKSIEYLKYDKKTNQCIYNIIDDDFICEISILSSTPAVSPTRLIVAVILEYSRRDLNVAKNLALYYLSCQGKLWSDINELCAAHKYYLKFFNKYHPELEFDKKYYQQTLDIIKKLSILA